MTWLIEGGVGPALVALPVNWAAEECAGLAKRWFRRLRRSDSLSRLIQAATGTLADLTEAEFDAMRKLLEDQQTWTVIGHGTLEDLATLIAACLQPRDGLTVEESLQAARTVARGLLEFVVADLDRALFQRILLARLHRLEIAQAKALDDAMLGLHTDLAAALAEQGEIEQQLFARVISQLDRVLARLSPDIAGRAEISIYLATLVSWLNADPWPRDRRFGGPTLTPAAIERKLQVTDIRHRRRRYLDADELAKNCRRLVVLGGPGSGKTWLAKRTVRRCAETAIDDLARGSSLEEIELPLFSTCSRLFRADGEIRQAVVSSAFDQLGDLGGSRLGAALRRFFTERNAPTVLVLDALDEAYGLDERLRQVDTLPWRIVLTSRPSSWNNQLYVNDEDDSHRVGSLRPLRYPTDVNPFIRRWFDQKPSWGEAVVTQIAQRPGLQKATTVPLILAFYCVIGGETRLPDFRRDLYERVLKRILTGLWHSSDDCQIDEDACLQVLIGWAWTGAASDPISAVGIWTDDIATLNAPLGRAERQALDHVATPLGPPDLDTRVVIRRFIHRSIREFLVARHVANMAAEEAAKELLPHIWYDPDWEYAAPAALVMHPQREQVLQHLIRNATRSDQGLADISAIDTSWEFRRFLALVASESSPADWTPQSADVIGQARSDLAKAGRIESIDMAAHWEKSNREVKESLTDLIAQGELDEDKDIAQAMARLAVTEDERNRARTTLLSFLRQGNVIIDDCRLLAEAVIQLGCTPVELRVARLAMLYGLTRDHFVHGILIHMETINRLDPTAEDRQKIRELLLDQLSRPWADFQWAAEAAQAIAQLDPTAQDRRNVQEILLSQLATTSARDAEDLAPMVALFAVTETERMHAREALLRLLAREEAAGETAELAEAMTRLSVTAEERFRTRQSLLQLLHREEGSVAGLANAVVQLSLTATECAQSRQALLDILSSEISSESAAWGAKAITGLEPTTEDLRQARTKLLKLLARETGSWESQLLAQALTGLEPTAQDRHQACGKLIKLLNRKSSSMMAALLTETIAALSPMEEDRQLALEALMRLLVRVESDDAAARLGEALTQLADTSDQCAQARELLLRRLAIETHGPTAVHVADTIASLNPTAEHLDLARKALQRLLVHETHSWDACMIGQRLARLEPTPEDCREARGALLKLLVKKVGKRGGAQQLQTALAELRPTVHDLNTWRAWSLPPTMELLAAIRRNSSLDVWLSVLPSLSGPL
jgi:hypothetical protein